MLSLFLTFSLASPLKIAVIDSGFDYKYNKFVNLCPDGHKSFVKSSWDIDTRNGHGTNIASIIDGYIKKAPNYCIMIIKVFDFNQKLEMNFLDKAINYAVEQKADIINMSLSGEDYNIHEYNSLQLALDKDILIFVAAGNNGRNLNKNCNIYPACYKFINNKGFAVIGNYSEPGVKHPKSNKASFIKIWEVGTNIMAGGIMMTGTSQATAVATGKFVRRFLTKVKKDNNYEN